MHISSYGQLNEAIIFYKNYLIKNININSKVKKILLNDLSIITTGLIWIQSSSNNLKNFQSNRYFLNAIQVKKLPTDDHLKSFLKTDIEPEKNLSKYKAKNYKDLILFFSKSILKDFKNNRFNKKNKLWDSKTKAFFLKNGYVVIPNVFNAKECNNLRNICLKLAKKEKENKKGYFYGFNNNFQRVYNVVNKSKELGELIDLPLVNYIMNDLFDRDTLHDKYTLSSHHINIVPPGGTEHKLHMDIAAPEPLPDWLIRMNVNFIFEDYDEHNGATNCLPGSHKFLKKPNKTDDLKFQKKMVTMNAPKGSIAIWTGHLWHKSGSNKSSKDRVALLTCFVASFISEIGLEENHPKIVKKKEMLKYSKNIQRLLLNFHGLKDGHEVNHN
jgi:hypothetical protein